MVALALRDTVQEFETRTMPGIGDFYGVTSRSPYASPAGTRARDRELRDLDRNDANGKFRGTRASIIKKEMSLPWEVTGKGTVLVWGVDDWIEVDAVAHFQDVLQNAHFGAGWQYFGKRLMRDYYTQDFGAFIEVIGPGPVEGPIQGAATGIAVLDSLRCFATGNIEHPIIYYGHITGKMHLMHHTRIIRMVDMPDGDERFYGAGECALSRYIATAWREILMTRYIESRLDDMPPPGLIAASNITDKQRDTAFAAFNREQGSDERPAWGKTAWVFGIDPAHPVTLTPITFSQAPEKFDLVTYSNHDINELALAFNTDKNEIWELSGGTLGSGQQSEIQAQKARGKVIADFTSLIERGLNIGVLPDGIDFAFKVQDEAQDKAQSDRDTAYMGIAREMHSMGNLFAPVEIRTMLADQSETFQQILTNTQGQVQAPDVNDVQAPLTPEVTANDNEPVEAAAPPIGEGVKKFDPGQRRADDGKWTDTGGGGHSKKPKPASGGDRPADKPEPKPDWQQTLENMPPEQRQQVLERLGIVPPRSAPAAAPAKPAFQNVTPDVAKQRSQAQLKKLAPDERTSIKSYSQNGVYEGINHGLRSGGAIPKEHEQTVARLDKALAKGSLADNTMLYRARRTMPDDWKVGTVIRDKAYVSTSTDIKAAEEFAGANRGGPIMRIQAPKGTKGLHTSAISLYPEESEFLMPRGQQFKITNITKTDGKTFVDMEVVQ